MYRTVRAVSVVAAVVTAAACATTSFQSTWKAPEVGPPNGGEAMSGSTGRTSLLATSIALVLATGVLADEVWFSAIRCRTARS